MKRRATKKTFKKAGFTKISCKYLERKANGKRTKTVRTIAYVKKGKVQFAKATPTNIKRIKKKGYKSEKF